MKSIQWRMWFKLQTATELYLNNNKLKPVDHLNPKVNFDYAYVSVHLPSASE
jgi:hypothetical protein